MVGLGAGVADVVVAGAEWARVVAAAGVADRAAGRVAVEQPVTVEAASNTTASNTTTARRRGTLDLLSSRPILTRARMSGEAGVVSR